MRSEVQVFPDPPFDEGKKKRKELWSHVILVGGIAQLGEHLLCKQGVRSSNLLTSTNNFWKRDSYKDIVNKGKS